MTDSRIIWIDTANGPLWLAARLLYPEDESHHGYAVGLSEKDIDPIQAWCEEHDCGRRMSFDMFRFRNQREKTMFLMVWG